MTRARVRAFSGLVALLTLDVGCDQIFDIVQLSADAGRPADAASDRTTHADAATTDAYDAPATDAHDATVTDAHDATIDTGGVSIPSPTFYVSSSVTDAGTSCTMTDPCSLAAAVEVASVAWATGTIGPPTIAVCAGDYSNVNLSVTTPTRLVGGYGCTGKGPWTLPGANAAASTTLHNANASMSSAILVFNGSGVKPGTIVEGFTIEATVSGNDPAATYTGIVSTNGASPTVTNNVIKPASSCGTTDIQVLGVSVTHGGSATLVGNDISGCGVDGAGIITDNSITSIVVLGNMISGGTGSLGYGVKLYGAAPDAGSASTFTVVGNAIQGGTGPGCGGAGLMISGAADVTVSQNRISGGSCTAPTTKTNYLSGVYLNGVVSPKITNNMILGGVMPPTTPGVVTMTRALVLNAVTNAGVHYNTLVGGYSDQPTALMLQSGGSGAVLKENILVGQSGDALDGGVDGGVGLLANGCGDASVPAIQVAAFEYNAVLNAPNNTFATFCPSASSSSFDAAAAGLHASTQGNMLVTTKCPGPPAECAIDPKCTTAAGCLLDMFPGWNTTSSGAANLFPAPWFDGGTFVTSGSSCAPEIGSGWPLGATSLCRVAQGVPADAEPGISADLYGADCRITTKVGSMGADQNPATCTNH